MKFQKYTMCHARRSQVLMDCLGKIAMDKIPGGICECGVFRGGQMMIAAETLKELGESDRDLYLFDTFRGLPRGLPVDEEFKKGKTLDVIEGRSKCSLKEVKRNMALTGYPVDKIHYAEGRVEDTLSSGTRIPLALLRLDMDLYSPTLHALKVLYPKLVKGGFLIVDDFGDWRGCRTAVWEYFNRNDDWMKQTPGLERDGMRFIRK